jgi:hypothetical protein
MHICRKRRAIVDNKRIFTNYYLVQQRVFTVTRVYVKLFLFVYIVIIFLFSIALPTEIHFLL